MQNNWGDIMKIDLLQEYKELYYHEIEHSERLNSKISTGLTLLITLISGEIVLWMDMFPLHITVLHMVYLFLCVFSLVPLGLSAKYFVKSYSGYDYQYFPIAKIKLNIEQSIDYSNTISDGKKKLNQHIVNMFQQKFSEDAVHNREQNLLKSENQRLLTVWLITSFVIVIPALTLWIIYINPQTKEQPPIQIVMQGGEIMCDDKETNGFPTTPPSDVFHETFTRHEVNIPKPPAPKPPETSKPE